MNLEKNFSKKILDFLYDNRLAVIVTISEETGFPQGAMVYYSVGEGSSIYFGTSKNSKKVRNIKKNDKMAIVIAQEVEPKILQLEGIGKVIDDFYTRGKVSEDILKVANSNSKPFVWPPLVKLTNSGLDFIEFTVLRYKFSDFSKDTDIIEEGAL